MSEYTCKFSTFLLINSASDNMMPPSWWWECSAFWARSKCWIHRWTLIPYDTLGGRRSPQSVFTSETMRYKMLLLSVTMVWFLLTGLFWLPTVSSSADMLLPCSASNPQGYRDGSRQLVVIVQWLILLHETGLYSSRWEKQGQPFWYKESIFINFG